MLRAQGAALAVDHVFFRFLCPSVKGRPVFPSQNLLSRSLGRGHVANDGALNDSLYKYTRGGEHRIPSTMQELGLVICGVLPRICRQSGRSVAVWAPVAGLQIDRNAQQPLVQEESSTPSTYQHPHPRYLCSWPCRLY